MHSGDSGDCEACRGGGDGLSGKGGSQSGGRERDSPAREQQMQLIQGAGHALARSVFAGSERVAYRTEVELLEKPEQNRGAVFRPERVNRLIEDRCDLGQIALGVVILDGIHFNRLPFTELTTTLATKGLAAYITGVPMQPPAHHHSFGKRWRGARQVYEHALSNVFCQIGVPVDQPDGRRVHEVEVASEQLTKGLF